MLFHEYSLIFFTVFAQTAVGAYILFALRSLINPESQVERYRGPLFVLWALMGVGFLFSSTHLGSPLRAFNAFNQVGTAWLSNEILLGAAFFAFGGIQWLLAVLNRGSGALSKLLSLVTIVFGAMFMYAMTNVYLIDTVVTWNTPYTTLSFALTMALCGLLLWQWMATLANDSNFNLERNNAVLALILVAISIVVTSGKAVLLGSIETSVGSAIDLVPDYAFYLAVQLVLVIVALSMWILPLINKTRVNAINLTVALVLLLASEILGRALFFSTHMTYGLV